MGIQVMAEVWQQAPVKGNDLLLLLRLADAAGEDHRMCWESVETLTKRTRMSRRNVFNCLKNLAEAGLIETVADEDAPRAARGYKSVVRRIIPAEEWPCEEGGAESARVQNATSRGERAFTQPTTNPSSNSTSLLNTSYSVSTTRAAGSKKPSKAEQAKQEQAREDGIDPFKNVLQEGPDATETAQEDKPGPLEPRTRKRRTVSPAAALARYFKLCARQVDQEVPGATNDAATRASIQKWLNDGFEYVAIRAMIDTYWSETFQRAEHLPAWQDFLARRGSLSAQGTKVARQEKAKEDRHDASKWGG